MSCLNCGHPSHCGIPLYKEEFDRTGEIMARYEVCKHCRCEREECGSHKYDINQ